MLSCELVRILLNNHQVSVDSMTRRYILNLPDSVRLEDIQLMLKNFPGASLEPESDISIPGVIAKPDATEAERQEALNAVIGLWEGHDISLEQLRERLWQRKHTE